MKNLKKLACLYVNGNQNLKKNKNLSYLCGGSKLTKLNLPKQEVTIYYEVKKGNTVSLKSIINMGYKVDYVSGYASYNKKTGTVKMKKKGYGYLLLKKGSKTIYSTIHAY